MQFINTFLIPAFLGCVAGAGVIACVTRIYRENKPKPTLQAVPLVPEWTFDDSKHLKTFLLTPTGQSLMKRARAKQAADAIMACNGKMAPTYAAGFGHAVDWLESLAISSDTVSARSNDTADTRDSDTSGEVVPEFAH